MSDRTNSRGRVAVARVLVSLSHAIGGAGAIAPIIEGALRGLARFVRRG